MHKRLIAVVCLCFALATASSVFGQANNGSVSGIVQDTSKALIPGVTITLTNTDTGVVDSRLTNESGVFAFPSVPPGPYKLTGELAGFKQAVNSNVPVGTAAQVSINLTLQVGAKGETVNVTASANTVHETTASVGEVLDNERVRDLPLVGGNVLDLLTVLPGFRVSGAGDPFDTVGGLGLDTVNATINGMTTNSSRNSAELYGYQVFTPIVVNPDLVGEIRLILAPVDAELGRGNSQVQIQTRSGTNKYTGSGVWNIQNSATNANTWVNNHTATTFNGKVTSNRTEPNWSSIHQLTGSFGGPIIKNKTFFFFLYDTNKNYSRTQVASTVSTDVARTGIFRYWTGYNPLNATTASVFASNGTTGNAGGASFASVDALGNPVRPTTDPSGTGPYTGELICFSVFGNFTADGSPINTATACPGGRFISHAAWDAARPNGDTTGFMAKVLKMMPHPNDYSTNNSGDGLNTAVYRYLRGSKKTVNANTLNAVTGTNYGGAYNNRWQTNIKIDHNINKKNRVSASWSYQTDSSAGILAEWENGYSGNTGRKAHVLTVNGTSTITASLVNESRFGLNYTKQITAPPWANPLDPAYAAAARDISFLKGGVNPVNGKTYPMAYLPVAPGQGFRSAGNNDAANTNPLWDYADTLRWTYGKHSFSFGAEYRRPITTGFSSASQAQPVPNASGGAITSGTAAMTPLMSTLTNFNNASELPGFLQTARTAAVNLNYLLSGSIAFTSTTGPAQNFWVNSYADLKAGTWQDLTTTKDKTVGGDPTIGHQERTQIGNEYSFFAKDDFKLTKRLTLNLGVRVDENMSPYLTGGLTNGLVDNGAGLYGVGRPLNAPLLTNWLQAGSLYLGGYGSNPTGAPLRCDVGTQQNANLPVSNCDPKLMTAVQFIGPGSPNPSLTSRPNKAQVSPAIGFAWQVPWFGEGKTSVRGGFQRTYGGAGGSTPSTGLGGDFITQTVTTGDTYVASVMNTGRAPNLTDVANLIPRFPTRGPGQANMPIANRAIGTATSPGGSGGFYASDYRLPYTDNITLSLTRNVNRKLTLDVRFVETIGRAQQGTIDLNTFSTFHNPELIHALDVTRAGGDDPLFDQLLMGLNLNTTSTNYGVVGSTVTIAGVPVLQRGSAQVRRLTAANLANGNYNAVVTTLFGTAITATNGAQALPIDPSTGVAYSGASQRLLRNGCDRLANGITAGFTAPGVGAIAPRCFPENYLITNPQLSTANLYENFGSSHYGSFQAQVTFRPVQGVTVNSTYSLSKTMTQPAGTFTDPLNRSLDYGPSLNSIGPEFRSNGTFELPIGPNKLIFGNSSGWFARAVEKWQTSFTYTLPSGVGRNILGSTKLYTQGRPDVVGPWTNPKGIVTWDGNNGNYFDPAAPYVNFADPQCSNGSVMIQTTDANGFNLKGNCTLTGLGQVVPAGTPGSFVRTDGRSVLPMLLNPYPGKQGNLGALTMRTVSRWTLNANASKRFRITESKSLQVRIDTTNVLNHPTPTDPVGLDNLTSMFAGSTSNFGQITSKTGNRTFQGQLRFSF